jgi:RNA polymerase sigma factor (TIGR02999 family)
MHDITQILQSVEAGDPTAAERLLPLVYEELRHLANVRMRNEGTPAMLQATALVHEVYLRLVDRNSVQHWNSRAHFFGAAAEAMRRILVEQARRRRSLRQGGGFQRSEWTEIACPYPSDADRILDIDEALTQLAEKDRDAANVVKLHIFAGFTLDEVAEALSISRATVYRNWAYARAMLKSILRAESNQDVTPTPP